MKTIYQFTYNFNRYRGTEYREVLGFARFLGMSAIERVNAVVIAGQSEVDIQLERI